MPRPACENVPTAAGPKPSLLPPPLYELLTLPEDELARQDIAAVNLACALGLPGAERINAALCLERLDDWATFVRQYTDHMWPRFQRCPADYHHSEGHFRALALATALVRHLGVRYNPAKMADDVPFDTADCFIHGILEGAGGTRATMPVVYVAVGRRLGYPLKLVPAQAKRCGHLFVRWDDPAGERFNIEATAYGLVCPTDDYYRTDKYLVSPDFERDAGLLKSKTPRQELAGFLNERGWLWVEHGCYCHGIFALAWANALAPNNVWLLGSLGKAMDLWHAELGRRAPPGFPPVTILTTGRLFPESLPERIEHDIMHLEVVEKVLRCPIREQHYWAPLRHGMALARKPSEIVAEHADGRFNVRFEFGQAR